MASKGAVGFIGLNDFSLEMAASLLRSGYSVQAFNSEIASSSITEFSELGGLICSTMIEAGKGVTALILLISHSAEIDSVLFSQDGLLKGLHKDVVIVLHTTLLPAYIEKILKKLTERCLGNPIVDLYAFKGTSEVSDGRTIIVTSSMRTDAITKAHSVIAAMGQMLFEFGGHIGAGSKVKMVVDLLQGIHLVASVEAIALGVQAGIHPWIVYDIISNAAGSSWVFKNQSPQWLRGEHMKLHALNSVVDNLGNVLGMAKSPPFPLPLLAVAHQQLVIGTSRGSVDNDDVSLFKVCEDVLGIGIRAAANGEAYDPEKIASNIVAKSAPLSRIGFIGLGAMGFGMATQLIKSKYTVLGYDVYKPTLAKFADAGGLVRNSPAELSKDVDVVLVMVTNQAQAEDVLFGRCGAAPVLPKGAAVIISSTVSAAYVSQLEQRLQGLNNNLKLVDAPVSGGVKRASMGTLTIMAAGSEEALQHCGSVLAALSEKLYIIHGGCGAGSCVKMVNQLLAGVHIASAAEALAFGAHLGLPTRKLFDLITKSEGTSWMLENRGPHMLDDDYTPCSALNIFVKDLGIVTQECSSRRIPVHIASVAHQLFLAGSAAGWGLLDDAAVVKVYESLTGIKVEGKPPIVSKEIVMKKLPAEWAADPIKEINYLNEKSLKPLVVLDDDPTGTQTVHDTDVLTEWSLDSLTKQFRKKPKCFFILTNSRALTSQKASALIKDICTNLRSAAKAVDNTDFTVVLRGDSTLRGHFPAEADAAISILGEMDAWIICPFFLQGGRYTIDDIHYVAESDRLIPAGDTEFAKDASFGYKSSNLREWVEEKTDGRVPASGVASVSIELIRSGGPDAVCEYLCRLEKGSTCIVNAASEKDIAVFAAGMLKAELRGKHFLCRTAASFVSSRIGIIPKAPVSPKDLGICRERTGGLIVVGSYVPKTTIQVEELILERGQLLKCIEVSVDKIAMNSTEDRELEITQITKMVDQFLQAGMDTLIMTSRTLITGKTPSESLEINARVSSAVVEIVRRITARPRYILAKGGITSSDLATKALEAKCARVVGQALAGVPLWQFGDESKHPGVPYIVFPGNVGDHKALAEVVARWTFPVKMSTKDLLMNAEEGGYAVGAFNVYNLEGIEAVVNAAEEQRSPAILQIHPGAFKQSGIPLVACGIAAAEQAKVPITVHFDHGSSKEDLVEVLELGLDSVMVDGSHLPLKDNIIYTKYISDLAHSKSMTVEGELGRLSGTEDGLTVEEYEARLTDINQAEDFIDETGIDALAVCIGNVHGKYPASGPNLRLDLLKDLYALASRKSVFLVLHGASGLSKELVKECIDLGVRKFNVNTELRQAYMESLANPGKDLVHVIASAKEAMKAVAAQKMQLFGSMGKA